MALPLNAVLETTLEGVLNGQKIMSVFHYQVQTPSATASVTQEVTDFLNQWTTAGAGSFFSDYLLCLPDNYAARFATAQAITPLRYVRQRIGKTGAGARPEARQSNLQASITIQTELAGRNQIGSKKLPMSSEDADAGEVTGGLKAALDNWTVDILANVTVVAGGGVYRPVIYHRPPDTSAPTPITRAFTQTTVRVMRRRTVGLGV